MRIFLAASLLLFGMFSSVAQVSYSGVLASETQGLSADVGVKIIGSIGAGGIEFNQSVTSFKIKSLTAGNKTIPVSQIPADVVSKITTDVRPTASYDIYVNNKLLKKYDAATLSWARILGISSSEGYTPAAKEAGIKLFNSGAISIRNVQIQSYSCYYCGVYANQLGEQAAKAGTTASTSKSTASNSAASGSGSSEVLINNSSNSNAAAAYNPLAGATSQSKFERDLEKGQVISDVANGVLDLFPDAAERQKKDQQAFYDNYFLEVAFDKKNDKINEVLQSTTGASKNYAPIAAMMASPSIDMESYLGTTIYNDAFGKTAQVISKTYRTGGGSKKQIIRNIESGNTDFVMPLPNLIPFFSVVSGSQVDYNLDALNIVSSAKNKEHNLDFIFDENNIVVGLCISLHTNPNYKNWYTPIENYTGGLEKKINYKYVLLSGSTYLIKDKIFHFTYGELYIYDLNQISDRFLLNLPLDNSFGIQFDYSPYTAIYEKEGYKKHVNSWHSDMSKIGSLHSKFVKIAIVPEGVLIKSVSGPSDAAGLKAGDIITTVQEISVNRPYQLQLLLNGFANENINLTYLRNGNTYTTTMKQ
jgi:PDZ domain